jgi:hypothetical protein
MSSPTLRQVFKFSKDIQGLKFAPNGASIAFLVENVLMVFYKHNNGLFVPACKPKIPEGSVEVKDLKWISPHEIQYSSKQPSQPLQKHREWFMRGLGDVVPGNYTICQHMMNIRKCESCGKKEAQYHEHEAKKTVRDEKDSSEKSMAKILDHGFVTIWSCVNETSSEIQETPTKKRGRESDPEQNDTGKVKQVKIESPKDVKSDSSVPASPKGRVLEDIRESVET